jgi:hypothetical protein
MSEPIVERKDVETALEARRELGPEYERHVVDSFVERIEHRLAERSPKQPVPRTSHHREGSFALALITLGVAIPITAIAATHGGIVALIVVWLGLVAINAVYNR